MLMRMMTRGARTLLTRASRWQCWVHTESYYDILEVQRNATNSEIKKAYRKLALALHPDKLPLNASGDEIEYSKSKFLAVQRAHETLSDPADRMQYDLTLLGSISEPQASIPRYTQRPFSIDARSGVLSFHFNVKFSIPPVKTIFVVEEIDISKVYESVVGVKSYYRQVPCPVCGGHGGENADSCRNCTFCDGRGHAFHLHNDTTKSYIHVMSGTCGKCKGRGCVPEGKCKQCDGQGQIMQESSVSYELPPGFPDGYTITYVDWGHELHNGRKGNLTITFRYQFPGGWRLIPNSLDLVFRTEIAVNELVEGFQRNVSCPNGRVFEVVSEPLLSVDDLVDGFEVQAGGFGLMSQDGTVGNLVIEILPAWDGVTIGVWKRILEDSGIEVGTNLYLSMIEFYSICAGNKTHRRLFEFSRDAEGDAHVISRSAHD